jgi:hypothetical protein
MHLITTVLLGCNGEYSTIGDPPAPVLSQPPDEQRVSRNDRYVQSGQPRVDVLFVVDTSGSMIDDQATLAHNLPELFNQLLQSGTDFHVGVTTADMYNDGPGTRGRLHQVGEHRFVDNGTPEPLATFTGMTTFAQGDSSELGRTPAFTLLELKRNHPKNRGFYRDDADLHVIFVTDDFDESDQDHLSTADFLTWLDNLKQPPLDALVHAIIDPPGYFDACNASENSRDGDDYAYYAEATGGLQQCICEPDWGPFMTEVGILAGGLKREFFLTDLPLLDPWTLEVEVITTVDDVPSTRAFATCHANDPPDTPECEVMYQPGRNSITFLDYVPPPFAEVNISYALASAGAGGR